MLVLSFMRKVVTETEEKHLMCFLFPGSLSFSSKSAGFRLLRLGAFPNFDQEPDESTWNVMFAARAV